jgi:hypothetical protein
VPLTPVAAERLAREAAAHPFDQGARALSIDWNRRVEGKQVQRWSEQLGEARCRQRQAEAADLARGIGPAGPPNAPVLLVVGMDGGRVQLRDKNPDTQSRWTEDKAASFTSYLPGDGADKPPSPLVTTYVGTMQNAEGFGPLVAVEARRRGIARAQTVLNISDGGAWIDPLAEKWRLADVRIIDYYHALEHLHEVAETLCGVQTAAGEALWNQMKSELWAGQVERIVRRLEEHTARLGPLEADDGPSHPRRVLWQNMGYFQKHREHMRYDQYRQKGWPIGSGTTEAGVKQFNKRVKGTDQFWNRPGAEAILALRELWMDQDDRWERYWANRSAYGFAQAA